MNEYTGCKIDYAPEKHMMKLTQPVLLQNFEDEFGVKKTGRVICLPSAQNSILGKGDEEGIKDNKTYIEKVWVNFYIW